MFSILIPTWNNLPFLKLCVESIRRHSAFNHEILVHVNEGSDGTLEWVHSQGLRHTRSTGNVGICFALNQLGCLASRDWLLYLNDDMVCTPGWDTALLTAASRLATPRCFLSSLVIEPRKGTNANVLFYDCGTDPASFEEAKLLAYVATRNEGERSGVASQPTLVRRELWHLVGGYSIEFGPGMSSDDDFLMKLWLAGCRDFQIVGGSLIYHFGCRSTGRVRRNRGNREFLMKWGITWREFQRDYLRRSATGSLGAPDLPASAPAAIPSPSRTGRMKRMFHGAQGFPLEDLRAWDADPSRHLVFSRTLSSSFPLSPDPGHTVQASTSVTVPVAEQEKR